MRIEILDMAEDDLVEGYQFYEDSEPGIGAYFLKNLCADIDSLKLYAGIHRVVYRKYHRLLAKRFPLCRLLHSCARHGFCSRGSGLPKKSSVDTTTFEMKPPHNAMHRTDASSGAF